MARLHLKKQKFLTLGLCMILAVSLPGCITTSNYDSNQTPGLSDPFEGFNRKVFAFNRVIDENLINPFLDGYRYVVPTEIRNSLSNVLNNLQSPATFANKLLQGDVTGAGKTLFATVLNTFGGLGGLIDVAGIEGYGAEKEDFGQTLGVWGIDHGPYIVVPVLGGASLRDGVGRFVDSFADPIYWYSKNVNEDHLRYNKAGLDYLNLRNNIKDALVELERGSIDYYASVRSSYYQAREKQLNDGKAPSGHASAGDLDFPDFDE